MTDIWAELAHRSGELAGQVFKTQLGHLVPFLKVCVEHNEVELLKGLWGTMSEDPKKLADQMWMTELGHIGSFFRVAIEHRHLLDSAGLQKQTAMVNQLWAALIMDSRRLADKAFQTQLDSLAIFFETCLEHGQVELAKSLWESLSANPNKLADQGWKLQLGNIGEFFRVAADHRKLFDTVGQEKQTHLINQLWAFLTQDPVKMAKCIEQLSTSSLSDFLDKAPVTTGQDAIRSLDCARWAFTVASPQPLTKGASLATRFGELGRDDLQNALTQNLLRRANWKDFSNLYSGLYEVAVLLAHVPDRDREAIPAFLDGLCTPKWLGWQYAEAKKCGSLASALRLLAFHHPPEVLRRFRSSGLSFRLETELRWFAALDSSGRHQVIQLLGTAHLLGVRGDGQWFVKLPLAEVARLPTEALPHRSEAKMLEDWQLQLWLGLRVVATQAHGSLIVDETTLAHTLELWRVNLAETPPKPNSSAYRVNHSMVEWLGGCISIGRGLLIPNDEPLWTLVGFPLSGA